MPSGTSWNAPFTLIARGTVTLRSANQYNLQFYGNTGRYFYTIIQGFTFDGINLAGNGGNISFNSCCSSASAVKIVQADITNNRGVGLSAGHFADDIELLQSSIHDGTFDSGGIGGGGNFTYPMYWAAQNGLIDGLDCYNFSSYCFHGNDNESLGPNNTIIRNSKFHDFGPFNGGIGGNDDHAVAILFNRGTNNRAYNNLIWRGHACYAAGNGTLNDVFSENTCYNMGGNVNGNYGGMEAKTTTTARNNIFANMPFGGTAIVNFGSMPSTVNTNFCPTAATGCSVINADPLFVDPTAGTVAGFQLQSGSPARNVGATLGTPYNTDYLSIPRPQGSAYDMGALESNSAVTIVVNITGSTVGACASSCTTTTNSISLSGSTTSTSLGAVTFATDRGSSGSATWSVGSNWTTNPITLKVGLNRVTISSTDAASNLGTVTTVVTYVPTFPGNSLVAAYAFEDGSGTSAVDSSGNSNTGTLTNGVTWITTGRYGKAISLNGINQFVSVSGTLNNTLNFTQSFTLSTWVQPSVSHTDFRTVVSKNVDPVTGVGYPYRLYATVTGFCGNGGYTGIVKTNGIVGPDYSACSSTPPLAVGIWTHIALTYDNAAGQLKLYKNGALITTTSATGYMEPTTGTLQIGGSDLGEYFQGLIDEVRIYNFAIPLTAASNTTPGLPSCSPTNFADNVASPSIVGNVNCPIINLNPPSQFKLSASATELKLGTSATAAKIGANP